MYNKKKAARQALLGYMKWWSEECYGASWLYNLHLDMFRDDAFRFLVESAEGWYIYDEKFIKGTYTDLKKEYIEDLVP